MSWLLIAILAYLIFALVFLVDKYLLVGPIQNPKIYTFYAGIFRPLVLLLIPFIDFHIPNVPQIVLSFLAGGSFILALFWFYKGLQLFETSRIVPAIGGILPIFSFLLVHIFSQGKEILTPKEFFVFALLVLGSFLITYEKAKKISLGSLKISTIAAFFFALSFVFSKYVYLAQPFLSGFIWIALGGALTSLFFLFAKEVREGFFKRVIPMQRKTAIIFFSNQILGAGANILQNFAIALAPLVYVSVINALGGTQYAFLLLFTVFLSLKFPKVLKEEISREIIFQKIIAILLIGGGLALLTL